MGQRNFFFNRQYLGHGLFADESSDEIEREKFKMQGRGNNQRRETPEKARGDGMDTELQWRS